MRFLKYAGIAAAILVGLLALILLAEFVLLASHAWWPAQGTGAMVSPKSLGIALFSTYLLGVELASMLLLAALVGALHLGRKLRRGED